MTVRLISSWSGGKDSCYALMKTLESDDVQLVSLLNMMNENGKISRSHGIPKSILQQHAKQLNVNLCTTPTSWHDYEKQYIQSLQELKYRLDTNTVVFGDIDIQSHKDWEEKVCALTDHQASLPLWQQDRKELVQQMIDNGIEAMITSCNTHLGEEFLGRIINRSLLQDLQDRNVDVCGENGEYHTLVINCPLFLDPIQLPPYSKTTHENYCFLNWEI